MEWANAFNMENVIVTSCSFGGPLAVRRDPKKIVKVQGSGKPTIYIYTAAGELVSSIVVSENIFFLHFEISSLFSNCLQ